MGATIKLEHGYVHAECKRLKGAEIYLDMATVTGTDWAARPLLMSLSGSAQPATAPGAYGGLGPAKKTATT